MSYLIYNIETTRIVRPNSWHKGYKTLAAATAAFTRQGLSYDECAIAETEDFTKNIEKEEIRYNLLTRKPFSIKVNTPACCDPSTETYHSM
jgi:hypothetical protein